MCQQLPCGQQVPPTLLAPSSTAILGHCNSAARYLLGRSQPARVNTVCSGSKQEGAGGELISLVLAFTPPLPFPLGFIPCCCCSGFKHPRAQGFLLLPSARRHADPARPAAQHGAGPVSLLRTPAGAQARCLHAPRLQEAGRVAAGQLRAARACCWQVWYVSAEPRVILGCSAPGRLLCCRTAGAACWCSDVEITPFLTAADHTGPNFLGLHNPQGCPQEQ